MDLSAARASIEASLAGRSLLWVGHRCADAYWLPHVVAPERLMVATCDWGHDIESFSTEVDVRVSLERVNRRREQWSLHTHAASLLSSPTFPSAREPRIVMLPYFAQHDLFDAATKRGWTFAGPRPEAKASFDNKLRLAEILAEAGLEAIPQLVLGPRAEITFDELQQRMGQRIVLQKQTGSTGKTTWVISDEPEFLRVRQSTSGDAVKVSAFVPGTLLNVNFCNTRTGVCMGRPSLKMHGIGSLSRIPTAGCGNDWTVELPAWVLQKIHAFGTRIGNLMLRRAHYLGMWGLDLIVDEENHRVWVVELNARFQGSTLIDSLEKIRLGLCPLPALHLLEFLDQPYTVDPNVYREAAEQSGSFAYLKLYQTASADVQVQRSLASGSYTLQGDALIQRQSARDVLGLMSHEEILVSCRVPLRGTVIPPDELVLKIEGHGPFATSSTSISTRALEAITAVRGALSFIRSAT